MLQQFVEKINGLLQLDKPLQPNPKGEYLLSLEPGLEILLRENAAPGITLFMTLASLPSNKRDDFIFNTLCANLFGKETGGSFLGCDREGEMVTLTRCLPAEASNRELLYALEEFANYAENWRKICMDAASTK